MSSIAATLVIFACVLAAGAIGMLLHRFLPEDHLSSESKDVVRLGMGLVATTLALVLGLLISSAKGFYDTQTTELTQLSANVVLLDRILAHYGPEAKGAREVLRGAVTRLIDRTWAPDDSVKTGFGPVDRSAEAILDTIQELSPKSDVQRSLQSQVMGIAIQMAQTRWLMFEQTATVPKPLLAVLVFWLAVLFMSFGLFIRANATVVIGLSMSALAVCFALFLILEMYHPYVGLIRVSPAPLRVALAQLGQ